MLDKLIDLLIQFIGLFQIYTFVDEYEQGVVLRCGRYNRSIDPGLRFLWPLGFETALKDNVVPTTENITEQTLTTRDGTQVIISIIIRWRISDIRKILLEVEDANGVLADCSMGELARLVQSSNYDDITEPGWGEKLYKAIRKRGWAWGIEVQEVQVTDLAKSRTIRLVN